MIKEADRMGGKILRVQMLGKFTMRYGEDHILFHKTGNANPYVFSRCCCYQESRELQKARLWIFSMGGARGLTQATAIKT